MEYTLEQYDRNSLESGDALLRLHRDELDAILIRNTFQPHELDTLCSNLSRIAGGEMVEMISHSKIFGYTFPRVHATANDFKEDYSDTLEEYFKYSAEVKRLFPELLSIDVEGRLAEVMEKLGGGLKVETPKGINSNGYFPPFTIRAVYPERGGLPLHTDKEFLQVNMQCYNHLSEFIELGTQSSYFVLLSAPDEEGALRFFTEEQAGEDEAMTTTEIFVNNKSTSIPDGAKKYELLAGDMIIFLSSKVPHQVDDFSGLRNRLTMGGYTGLGVDHQVIYYWS